MTVPDVRVEIGDSPAAVASFWGGTLTPTVAGSIDPTGVWQLEIGFEAVDASSTTLVADQGSTVGQPSWDLQFEPTTRRWWFRVEDGEVRLEAGEQSHVRLSIRDQDGSTLIGIAGSSDGVNWGPESTSTCTTPARSATGTDPLTVYRSVHVSRLCGWRDGRLIIDCCLSDVPIGELTADDAAAVGAAWEFTAVSLPWATDITDLVDGTGGVQIRSGMDEPFGSLAGGTCEFTVDDVDGSMAALLGAQRRPVRVMAEGDAGWRCEFAGWTDSGFPVTAARGVRQTKVRAVDALGVLAQAPQVESAGLASMLASPELRFLYTAGPQGFEQIVGLDPAGVPSTRERFWVASEMTEVAGMVEGQPRSWRPSGNPAARLWTRSDTWLDTWLVDLIPLCTARQWGAVSFWVRSDVETTAAVGSVLTFIDCDGAFRFTATKEAEQLVLELVCQTSSGSGMQTLQTVVQLQDRVLSFGRSTFVQIRNLGGDWELQVDGTVLPLVQIFATGTPPVWPSWVDVCGIDDDFATVAMDLIAVEFGEI